MSIMSRANRAALAPILGLFLTLACDDSGPLSSDEPLPIPEPIINLHLELSTNEGQTGDTVTVTGTLANTGLVPVYFTGIDCGRAQKLVTYDAEGNEFSLTPPSLAKCAVAFGIPFEPGARKRRVAYFSGTVWSGTTPQTLPPGDYTVVAKFGFRKEPHGGERHFVTDVQELRWN
jgi:hypothetical protein